MLRAKLGARAARVPTWTIPDWLIWLGSFVSPTMATLYPLLGKVRHSTGEKATCVHVPSQIAGLAENTSRVAGVLQWKGLHRPCCSSQTRRSCAAHAAWSPSDRVMVAPSFSHDHSLTAALLAPASSLRKNPATALGISSPLRALTLTTWCATQAYARMAATAAGGDDSRDRREPPEAGADQGSASADELSASLRGEGRGYRRMWRQGTTV